MSANTLKILKLIVLLLVGFVLFIFAASFMVDTDFSTERSVEIEKPIDDVFEYIRHLRNQDEYSAWAAMDPNMTQEFRGTDGTVGFVSAWEGEETGKGEQEIVEIIEGERIDFKLRFFEPFESEADVYMITDSLSENRTRVIWGLESSMNRPMNLMLLFVNMEEAIGNDYDEGLAKLKEILENG